MLKARALSAKVTADAKAMPSVALNGTFTLGDVMALEAEGVLGPNRVQAQLEATGELMRWSASSGATAASHQGPTPSALREALGLGLVRLGLRAIIGRLLADEPIEFGEGGLSTGVTISSPTSLGPDTVGGEACTRVSFSVMRPSHEARAVTTCVSDATGLPLDRREGTGEQLAIETYVWRR